MLQEEFGYNIIFLILLFAVIYPPQEFISAGLTVENIFAKYLGSESLLFIHYHINRSCLMLMIHSVLPIIYFVIYYLYFGGVDLPKLAFVQYFWYFLITLAIILPFGAIALICYYKKNNWENHPIPKILVKYSNTPNNASSWTIVANEINNEYRRNDKLIKRSSAINKIIVTENWIMKTSLYFVHFAHQSDSALIAVATDTHNISPQDANDAAQFVNIEVKPTREGVKKFTIRISTLDFKDLQDRVNRPITVLSTVKFHTSIIDRFIEVFNKEIEKNPRYSLGQNVNLEPCLACMAQIPDVKINKQCLDGHGVDKCTNCFCRPLWCKSCLARWFASRQDQNEKETWLSSKCNCPMCRSRFCILDVCLLSSENS
ncbi:hypothetical protein PVAND_001556 [Polypedilum vanderplanki]|uniref:Transmembrane protein n=1 Tax=Polypedilum vanderplanki TaxID=319348 RepID=A0A9J6BPL5_POLVA|nr:hypothetical protein PVAND_001556 [Polypedilum vanderplanki]